jgi:protein-S-isoprenylcysteine O-methyltransferase Ste14
LTGRQRGTLLATVFLAIWLSHYVQRAFAFPFLLRGDERPMPAGIVAGAIVFNCINGYFQGYWLFELAPRYPRGWLVHPRFLAGLALFVLGWILNRWADAQLRALRAPGVAGERHYAIPRGGLFEWISCPNYFGEIVLWIGWAVLTWSAAGASFALWTIANLAPRAWATHRWYRDRFAEYPPERRALIPGIW